MHAGGHSLNNSSHSQLTNLDMNMASETTPPTPPPLVRIVCSPYDSDSEDEFAAQTSPNSLSYPSSERKKARTRGGSKKITFLDGISRNAAGLQRFGQSMAVHANNTLQRLAAPETDDEESDGYDSDYSQPRWRKSKLDLLMVKALNRADKYAALFCNVVDSDGFICGADDDSYDSWSSFEEDMSRRERRHSRTKKNKRTKKKASSAVPYDDGNLSDSLSVTSGDVSYTHGQEYTFEDVVNKCPTEVSSSPKEVAANVPCPKASLLRQRREEFLRRKDSGGDAIAVSRGAKRPAIKKPRYVPSQELRANYFGSSKHGDFDRETFKLTRQQDDDDDDDELYGENIPDLVDSSSNDDSAEKKTSSHYKYKWQSKFAQIDIPFGDAIFLTSSHLGPSVSHVPFDNGGALQIQIADIIIRVNGEDVSSMEGSVVENILKSMRGKSVQVSFLRKRMSA